MGTLNEDLQGIKTVEDTLTSNKVSRFAYTEEAYTNNNANGVDIFDPDSGQNIPNPTPSIMQVNPSVVEFGWRAQASSLTRMLMNHFLGRLSYNLNKVNDNMSNLLSTFISHLGTANGVATLDSNGRIPYSQLPESAIEYKGNWDASTNTTSTGLHLANGTGVQGDFYICTVAGTCDFGAGAITFLVNDRVIYDGSIWTRLSAGDVRTVCNKTPDSNGNVALVKGDVGLGSVVNTGDSAMPVQNGTTKFTTGGAYEALLNLAPYFNPSTSYSVGSYVTYQGKLYKCITVHSGAWNSSHFQLTVATNDSDYSTEETLLNKKWIDGKPIYRQIFESPVIKTQYINDISFPSNITCSCVFNGTLYVGTASNGIYYSTNGVTFTQNTSFPTSYGVNDLCVYKNQLYVATVGHGVYYSVNGTSFSQSTGYSHVTPRNMIIFNSRLYITANDTGTCYTTDGSTFTSVFSAESTNYLCIFNNALYIGSRQGLYVSTDGETDTRIVSTAIYGLIAYKNTIFYGTMSSGLYYSTDGTNFVRNTTLPTNIRAHYFSVLNDELYIGMSARGVFTSIDAINFQRYSFFTGTDGLGSYTLSAPVFNYKNINYIPTTTGLFRTSSRDTITYAYIPLTVNGGTAFHVSAFCEFKGKLYIGTKLGSSSSDPARGIYTSTNGVTFTQNTSFPTSYGVNALCVYNDKLYAGTVSHGVYVSTDGVTFTQTTFPTSYSVNTFSIFENILFIGSVNHGVYTTTDGTTFTQNTSLTTNLSVTSLHAYKGIFYAGTSSGLFTSTDKGTTFVKNTSYSASSVKNIVSYKGQLYVYTASATYISTDGTTFSTTPFSYTDYIEINDKLYACNANNVYVSNDGASFSSIVSLSGTKFIFMFKNIIYVGLASSSNVPFGFLYTDNLLWLKNIGIDNVVQCILLSNNNLKLPANILKTDTYICIDTSVDTYNISAFNIDKVILEYTKE